MGIDTDWYSHDDDGHVEHRVFYSHRVPGEFYYGFEPHEPDPVGTCSVCGEDVYNEDYIAFGEIVCPACAEYWRSNDIVVDHITDCYGSVPTFIKEHRYDDWFEQFAEAWRIDYDDAMFKWFRYGEKDEPVDARNIDGPNR